MYFHTTFCLFSLKYQLCGSTVLDPGKWQKLGILGACVHWDRAAGAAPSDSFSPFVSPHLSGGLSGTRVPPPKSTLSYPFPEFSFLSDLMFSFFHPPN